MTRVHAMHFGNLVGVKTSKNDGLKMHVSTELFWSLCVNVCESEMSAYYERFKGTKIVSDKTSGLYINRMPLSASAGTSKVMVPLREFCATIEPKNPCGASDCNPNASPSALIN